MTTDQFFSAVFDSAEGFWAWFWQWFAERGLPALIALAVGFIALVVVRRVITHLAERIASSATREQEREAREAAEAAAAKAQGARAPRPRRWISPQVLGGALGQPNPAADRAAQRARTVGSVLRSTANIVIGTITVLWVLSALGADVTGLLAGAGIVGVAVGFGAQSLVKDFLSGIFLLIEDQFGVGDYVDLGGGATGTVEAMGLRLTELRSFDGTLWYVRNGEIVMAGNHTQQWSRAVAPVMVPVGSDVTAVRTALERAVVRAQQDPETAPSLLETPIVRGVDSVDAFTITFTLHGKVRPGDQWPVARTLRAFAQAELLQEGIVMHNAPSGAMLDKPAE